MDKSIINEVVSALEAVNSYGQPGFWILLGILIVLVLVIAAVMYQRIGLKGNTGELRNDSRRPQKTCIGGQEAG